MYCVGLRPTSAGGAGRRPSYTMRVATKRNRVGGGALPAILEHLDAPVALIEIYDMDGRLEPVSSGG
jgi:hypothetical protein